MADSMQQDIDKLHKQIQKLNEFDRQTKNLFATSLEEMQLANAGFFITSDLFEDYNYLIGKYISLEVDRLQIYCE
ncbi:LXG domain-containing protein [Enterococcus faecalis]|nr:LXG domain-containing protein [Enterococcus faecalis]